MPADARLCVNNLYSAVDWRRSASIIITLYFTDPTQMHISFVTLAYFLYVHIWLTALFYLIQHTDTVATEMHCSGAQACGYTSSIMGTEYNSYIFITAVAFFLNKIPHVVSEDS